MPKVDCMQGQDGLPRRGSAAPGCWRLRQAAQPRSAGTRPRVDLGKGMSEHHDLGSSVAAGLEQHQIHPDRGLEAPPGNRYLADEPLTDLTLVAVKRGVSASVRLHVNGIPGATLWTIPPRPP